MIKRATTAERTFSKPNPPGLDLAPAYIRERDHVRESKILEPDEGVFRPGMPYRPLGWKGPIDTNNPQYQGLMFRDMIGPLWNRSMRYWQGQREKKWNNWQQRQTDFVNDVIRNNGKWNNDIRDFEKAENDFKKAFPPPPQPTPFPRELYMTTPYTEPNGKGTFYYNNGEIVP